MDKSPNYQNNEDQGVTELIRDFQLTTNFLADGATQHTVYRVSDQSRHRRPSRINETWNRKQQLGKGGFGCVWLEKCGSGPGEGKLRAVKEIRNDSLLLVSYTRELEAMAKFSHRRYVHCFVECYGWYKSEDKAFIAMEYIEHGDLQNYMNEPFSEAHANIIVSQLVEGLEYMHENGFAHRDLKPKNILVYQPGPDWWVKIGDFGISKRAESTALRTVIGTEGYIAPEVMGFTTNQSSSLSNDFSYSFTVDMWALGELLFRMITQCPVFPNQSDLFYYVINRAPFPVAKLKTSGASQDCCNFVTECMAVDPKHRLKASEAAVHSWMQTSWPPLPSPSPSPSPFNGRSLLTRGREVSPPSSAKVPPGPPTLHPPTAVHFEDTAQWSGSQEHQQVYIQRMKQEEPNELLRALQNRNIEVVEALLKGGADITVANKDGQTPLHLASQNGHFMIVRELIRKRADVKIIDKNGWTPLHLASQNGYAGIIRLLAEKNGNVTTVDETSLTPLHWASGSGRVRAVEALLKKGADVMTTSEYGSTPLHFASQNGHIDVVQLLLSKGAKVTATDEIGLTPLHLASLHGYTAIVTELLKEGADIIRVGDKNGREPIHLALQNGHIGAAKVLLDKGADIDAVDNEHLTPLELAQRNGHRDIVKAQGMLI